MKTGLGGPVLDDQHCSGGRISPEDRENLENPEALGLVGPRFPEYLRDPGVPRRRKSSGSSPNVETHYRWIIRNKRPAFSMSTELATLREAVETLAGFVC